MDGRVGWLQLVSPSMFPVDEDTCSEGSSTNIRAGLGLGEGTVKCSMAPRFPTPRPRSDTLATRGARKRKTQ